MKFLVVLIAFIVSTFAAPQIHLGGGGGGGGGGAAGGSGGDVGLFGLISGSLGQHNIKVDPLVNLNIEIPNFLEFLNNRNG